MLHNEQMTMLKNPVVPDYSEQLIQGVADRTARITIIGQGYVGLPLASAFATEGFDVIGLDTDKERVSRLNGGYSATPDVSDDTLRNLIDSSHYRASHDYSVLKDSDVIIICVPTPLRKSKDPDISYVLGAAKCVAETLRPGQAIILESTTYPGTTDELLLPLFEAGGWKAGKDFFLAFSPERIDPGNRQFEVREIPKVTGGITPACTRIAATVYSQIVSRVIEVSSPKVAELAKLYENVFRSVNIALANEFALMCRELDVNSREVIDAAASKPFGFMPFYPGPGIGGHCIPVDPSYLVWKMRFSNFQAKFIPLAEEINQSMPEHVVWMIGEALNARKRCVNAARILVLGVAYKRGVGDIRESPALQVISLLLDKGAVINYADPHVPEVEIEGKTFLSDTLTDQSIAACDCVVILTDHPEFDYQYLVDSGVAIIDTRDATWGMPAAVGQISRI